jgi:hypothetical protein
VQHGTGNATTGPLLSTGVVARFCRASTAKHIRKGYARAPERVIDRGGGPADFSGTASVPAGRRRIVDNPALHDDVDLEIEPIVLDERAAAVFGWRLEELHRAGYAEYAAALAEDNRIDLHVACDLLRNGCPEETAYRILA